MDIKKLRLAKEWTQFELARRVGVSANTIRGWEAKVTEPNEENYQKLVAVFFGEG